MPISLGLGLAITAVLTDAGGSARSILRFRFINGGSMKTIEPGYLETIKG